MRERTVKRYYCDFCKKAGLSKFYMQRHEDHCTMNPNRGCRMCVFVNGGNGTPIAEMLALLPDPITTSSLCELDSEYQKFAETVNASLAPIRLITDNCPACIMAAYRQKGIPIPMLNEFDFKKESAEVFSHHNQENADYGY